jgi:hypothetical protein
VGKLAIMQTLAENLAPSVTCLSFFFSDQNRRNDLKMVFPMLAYRLAIASEAYHQCLEENLAIDPDFLAKNLKEQFKQFFIYPFSNDRVGAISRCVVLWVRLMARLRIVSFSV